MTISIKIRFRSSVDEMMMIAGATAQGCNVQHLGGGWYIIDGVSYDDYNEMRSIARNIYIL